MLRPASARSRAVVLTALGAYVLALALVAFWPTHVDEGAGQLLQAITRRFPWATYGRIEFSANIALFAPFGLLLTLLVRSWWWVIAAGALASTAIELCQGVFLAGRTASPWDVVANTLGTIAGVVIGVIWRSSTSRVRAPA